MAIVQGDNGHVVPVKFKNRDLTSATVIARINDGKRIFSKSCSIVDAVNGLCELKLISDELLEEGFYTCQATATYSNGDKFSTEPQVFKVTEIIGGVTLPDPVVPSPNESGILTFETLSDLQTAYPNGTAQPVWITSENSWYYWEGVVTEPDTTAPNNVTGLTTSNVTSTSLTLSWVASTSTDETGYDVYRGTTLLGTVTGTTYNVSSLTASTAYEFTVKTKDGSNNISSGVSVNVTTTNVADTTAPNNVTNLASSNITQTGATLTWTASTSTDVANYQIYNGTTNIGQASGTTFEISGLTAGTQYNFVVKTKDASANESSGTSISVTTTSADTTAPVLTITPAATFTTSQSVTMSTNETATIYYTTDGTTPTVSSTVYSTDLTLSATTTVKAFAKDTAGNSSAVQTVVFTKDAGSVAHVTDSLQYFVQSPSAPHVIPSPSNYFGDGTYTFSTTLKGLPINTGYVAMREEETTTTQRVSLKMNHLNQLTVTFKGRNTSTTNDYWATITPSSATYVDPAVDTHVVIVKNATHFVLYLNNVQSGQASWTNGTHTFDSAGVKPLSVGVGTGATIKNIAYYSRPLTTEELTQNYNALK